MDSLLCELLMSIERKSYLASRGDKNQFRIFARWICEHVRSLRNSGSCRVLATINGRHRLPSERDYGWLVPQLHRVAIALNHFVCIGRTQDDKSRNRSQRNEVVDRLSGGSVVAVDHSH